jgi:hypothetical protein
VGVDVGRGVEVAAGGFVAVGVIVACALSTTIEADIETCDVWPAAVTWYVPGTTAAGTAILGMTKTPFEYEVVLA